MATNAMPAADELDVSTVEGNAQRLRLLKPRFRRNLVERRSLLARLAAAREYAVVRIRAPAGFGKTILAAQLSDIDPRPSRWIALTDADNDPAALLSQLAGTLELGGAIAPRIARKFKPLRRPDEAASSLFGDELASCGPFVLVLDDVGLVTHRDSRAILSFLVEHAPPQSQVVLVSRTEAEIPLARLRASGEVLDLCAADLAFDASEIRELLATGGRHLSDRQIEDVRERAEGWPAGIALAMLPQEGRAVVRDLPSDPFRASHDVAIYLREEALQRQPPEVQRFLLASSLLRRMSPALCDAALQITNSAQILAGLERDSLFLVSIGGNGEWHRYHPIFRDLLETELRRQAPELIVGILSRAATWHEHHGDNRESFEYAHASGDLAHAGRIVLRSGGTLIARGQVETVRGWLARCTREELESEPLLALEGAWVALLSGKAAEAGRLAAVAYTAGELDVASPDGATSLRSSLANLRARLAVDGISEMRRDGELVVAAEQRAGTRWVVDGWRAIGTAHLLDGHPEEAIAAFAEALSLTEGRPDLNFITIHCLGCSALAASDARDWRRARKWAREAHALTTESSLQDVVQSVAPYVAHATVLLHDGLIPQARKAVQHVQQNLPLLHAMRWFEADISLRCADLNLDLGDMDSALELSDVARGALSHYPDPGLLLPRLTALDARLRSGGELQLTPSELRLIPFLSSHLSLKEIGDRIYLSRATVKTHTDSIYRKLSVSCRSSAVDRLEALGLCADSPAAVAA